MGQELPAAKNLPRIKLVTYFSFSVPTAELFLFAFCTILGFQGPK